VRTWLVLICLTGCSLYFGDNPPSRGGGDDDVVAPPPDQPPGSGPVAIVRCEDGWMRRVQVPDFAPTQPGHGAGTTVGQCEGACQSAAYVCPGGNCDGAEAALCGATQSSGEPCSLEGASCSGTSSVECPATTTCGYSVAGSSCACSNGVYACTAHGETPSIQQQLVGKWQGTVHPPSFSADYAVSLWIYPDGTYWAECDDQFCTAFYYGGDGPYPDRTISILAASSTEGAWANIGIYFGSSPPNVGAIQALTVSDTTLRFTFNASWFGCGQPFFFDLTRVP
jgi:hypothetical protein